MTHSHSISWSCVYLIQFVILVKEEKNSLAKQSLSCTFSIILLWSTVLSYLFLVPSLIIYTKRLCISLDCVWWLIKWGKIKNKWFCPDCNQNIFSPEWGFSQNFLCKAGELTFWALPRFYLPFFPNGLVQVTQAMRTRLEECY